MERNWNTLTKEVSGRFSVTGTCQYNNLFKRADLTALYNKRLQDMAIFVFKVKHSLLPQNILDLQFYNACLIDQLLRFQNDPT